MFKSKFSYFLCNLGLGAILTSLYLASFSCKLGVCDGAANS